MGRLEQFRIVRRPSGDILMAMSVIVQGATRGGASERIQSIDLQQGEHRSWNSMTSMHRFVASWNDVTWFYDLDSGLMARNTQTLDLLIDQKQLITKNPALAAGIVENGFFLHPQTHQMVISTNDGYLYSIDPQSFIATRLDEQALSSVDRMDIFEDPSVEFTSRELTMKDGTLFTLNGSLRQELQKMEQGTFHGIPSDAPRSFLDGSFLEDGQTQNPIESADGNSFFILHRGDSQGEEENMVSRVTVDGAVLWEKELFDPKTEAYVKAVMTSGEKMIVITDQEVLAIQKEDGAIAWRVTF
jgi:hypothetical protein